jgi:hypothetical protein
MASNDTGKYETDTKNARQRIPSPRVAQVGRSPARPPAGNAGAGLAGCGKGAWHPFHHVFVARLVEGGATGVFDGMLATRTWENSRARLGRAIVAISPSGVEPGRSRHPHPSVGSEIPCRARAC